MRTVTILVLIGQIVLASSVFAQETGSGQVQLPLDDYARLIEMSRQPVTAPRPVPASYALGNARMSVNVSSGAQRTVATVTVELTIDVLEDGWVLVPILPAGTPVETVTVDDRPVRLIAGPTGIGWATDVAGSYRMRVVYRVDTASFEAGYGLSLPVVEATSTQLTATLPGVGLDVAVIPSAGAQSEPVDGQTRVTATVPSTTGLQISWRVPTEQGHALSRASYSGRLVGDVVLWTGQLDVDSFTDDTATLELMPRSVTLSSLQVDGEDAPILVADGQFVTLVRGRGTHRVTLGFQVPVVRGDGPPHTEFRIPEIPVSRFELTLPGKKEVTANPSSGVTTQVRAASTVATVHVPMTRHLRLSWSEALPEDIEAATRVDAAVYHAVHAEEGVLHVHAMVLYDVRRGETNVVELLLPDDVQVNRIDSESGAVIDWRPGAVAGGRRSVKVFLDRQLRGELFLDVRYDRSLSVTAPDGNLNLPLLAVAGAQRARGMAALLSSSELTLTPVEPPAGSENPQLTRVGENQLPAYVRERVSLTIAHTFKYVESPVELLATASEPAPVDVRFDAQVDTLTSLGEVAVTGRASVGINVKSGRTSALRIGAPPDLNLLSLTAPSLRTYQVTQEDGQQWIDVEFTQEMEGQFRVEVTYEQILADAGLDVEVPTLSVSGADVEQGRVAVEALTAAEVQPITTERLTAVDVDELPRQLVLQTTNPILLAYAYSRREPPPRLVLSVTQHGRVETQEAAIDRADYRTLITRDGLSVTVARFWVRNSRKQFLRVDLPEGSEIWSTFVNGKPEKPALASDGEADRQGDAQPGAVLIKVLNNSEGFPLELTYATRGPRVGRMGIIQASLPRPDILVTDSRWDVYLPDGVRFGDPTTNMTLARAGAPVLHDEMARELGARVGETASNVSALRISVPASGVHYRLEKLYANQSDVEAWFSIPYASVGATLVGQVACLTGTLLLWFLVWAGVRRDTLVPRRAAVILAGIGALLILVPARRYGVSLTPSIALSVALMATLAGLWGWAHAAWWKARVSTASASSS